MAPTQPGCFGHTQSQRPGTPHRNSVPSLPAPPALPREALPAPRPGLLAQEGRREARNSFLHGALQVEPSPGRLPAPSAAAFGLQRSRSGGCSFVLEMPAGMSCPVLSCVWPWQAATTEPPCSPPAPARLQGIHGGTGRLRMPRSGPLSILDSTEGGEWGKTAWEALWG